jgi:4-amino-4-deoxy-L-arabinose transferase-like glycosyltransferase
LRLTNRIFSIGIILLAFALRLHNLGTASLWYDELLQLDIAQGPLDQIWPQLERHAAMPLDYYLLYGWIKLGHQEAWVRFLPLFFGTLAVPLIYVLAARLFNRTVGYLAAILLAWSSFAINYSQESRPYALLMLLVMAGSLGLWQAYKTNQKRYWLLALVGLIGAVLSHYFALFMLVPFGLWVAGQQLYHLKSPRFWQRTAYFAGSIFILIVILLLTGHLRRLYNVSFSFSKVVYQPEALTLPAAEKPNRGAGPPQELSFFRERVLMPFGSGSELDLLIYNAYLLVAVLVLARPSQRRRAALVYSLSWFILPTFLIYLFLVQRGTFFAVRYILYTLPAYLILVAYGIETLFIRLSARFLRRESSFRWATLPYVLLTGLIFLLLVPLVLAEVDELITYYTTDSREDWRAVGQLLRDNARPEDAVIAVKAEPAINWYYPPARSAYDAFSHSQAIWDAMEQHQRRWFVLSSYSYKRDQGLRDWLQEQHAVTIAIDRRVVVHFHQEGLTAEEMLIQVRTFALPQKSLTYAVLADQFEAVGDFETSRVFYQRAAELADGQTQQAAYRARLAAAVSP